MRREHPMPRGQVELAPLTADIGAAETKGVTEERRRTADELHTLVPVDRTNATP